jgi:hypothetical protein
MTTWLKHLALAGLGAALIAGCGKSDAGKSAAKEAAASTTLARDTGIPECTAYLTAMDKFVACPKLRPEEKDAYFQNTRRVWGEVDGKKMSGDAKKKAAEDCKQALTELGEGAKFRDCPIG